MADQTQDPNGTGVQTPPPPPGFVPVTNQSAESVAPPPPPPGFVPDATPLSGGELGASQATGIGPRPSGTLSGLNNWLDDVQADVKNGTHATWVGSMLSKLGAKGTDYGVAPGAANLAPVGFLTGIPKVQSVPELVQGHPVRAVNKLAGGAMETLGPLAVTQPEAMVGIVPGMIASHYASAGAKALGADDDTAELVGNIGGLVAGGQAIKTTHLNSFEGAVNSRVAAETAYKARNRGLAVATDGVKAAQDAFNQAEQASTASKGTPQEAEATKQLDTARTAYEKSLQIMGKAQDAFQAAHETREAAAARVQQAHDSLVENSVLGQAPGAVTDAASSALSTVGDVTGVSDKLEAAGGKLRSLASEPMNSLLRANKPSNYLYGKNPGQAFIDEEIKIPKNSITLGGQLENLHGQLESAQENLSQQLKTALSDPDVAAKRIDIVPTVKDAVIEAKKFISKQTGLDVPKYTEELNKLQDSILTQYDDEGNPTGKLDETQLSPAEVADVKRSLGKNTQWRVLPTDPEIQLKNYLNSVRKKIYGQLADTVEQAAPDANVKELNQRLANSIEAQGLLEKRIAYEHGTGGYNAAARKLELFGGLLTAILSPEPVSKSLGGMAVADRALRSVAGRMLTSRGLNAAGKFLQGEQPRTAGDLADPTHRYDSETGKIVPLDNR